MKPKFVVVTSHSPASKQEKSFDSFVEATIYGRYVRQFDAYCGMYAVNSPAKHSGAMPVMFDFMEVES